MMFLQQGVQAASSLQQGLRWLRRLGGPGLLVLSVADSSPLPLPGGSADVLLIVMAARHSQPWYYYALMATIGSVIGGILSFEAAEAGGAHALEKRVGPQRAAALFARLNRHGSGLIASGALLPPPFPFTAVVMAAGIARMPRRQFVSALAVSRCVRYAIVAWLGDRFGRVLVRQLRSFQPTTAHLIAAAVVAATIVALAWLTLRLRRDHTPV